MLVALLNPPWLADGRVGVRAGSRWSYTVDELGRDATIPFPFFLAYAAAMLERDGFDAALLDGVAERAELDPYLDRVERLRPDLIIYETSTPAFPYDCEVAARLRERLPQARIAFAGPHVTVFPEQTLREQPAVDYVLLGEYEETALELARRLRAGEPADDLPGLAARVDGGARVNPRRPLIQDLDALPFPQRVPDVIYRYHESFCKRRPNAQLLSSRGCVFRCPFCLWPKVMYGGPNLRARSPERVVDEIERLERDFDFREYYFDDDAINLKPGHVEALCDELDRRGLRITWACMGHAGRSSPEQVARLRAAGCEAVKWGVETGDPDLLASLRKGVTLDQLRRVFAACREHGVRTHATFTVGLPGETRDSLRRTKEFMLELAPDSVQISITTPFPGTDLWRGGPAMTQADWRLFDGAARAAAPAGELSAEELEAARDELQAAWDAFARSREGAARRLWRAVRRRLGG